MGFGENSKLRLITFLGTGKYAEVKYIWNAPEVKQKESKPTSFFPDAIDQFLDIREILLLATQEARKGLNFEKLPDHLKEKLKVKEIPDGKKESELWQIFDSIVSEVETEDEIVLDITHGFRSIPMIVFSVADYLRKTKSVVIRYILYGAYDAGEDTQAGIRKVPIFDLTLLLDLMEWAGGLETFLKRGDANLIGEKIHKKHQSLHSKGGPSRALPRDLQSVGKKLNKLSISLHLARVQEVLKDAHGLLEILERAKNELSTWVKPFATILDQIEKELKGFAYKESDKLNPDNLEKQLALIKYYYEKGLLLQATLLAREWIVSYVILHYFPDKHEKWTIIESRQEVEKFLNEPGNQEKNKLTSIIKCWHKIGNLRNDLAHCGMRKDSSDSKSIESKVKKILGGLDKLLENNSAGTKGG